jgi:hypothetical protein
MDKITQLQVVKENGETLTWFGNGTVSYHRTQTPVDDKAQPGWPFTAFIQAHLSELTPLPKEPVSDEHRD